MKPATALLALCLSACAGSPNERSTVPTGPGALADSCALARFDVGAFATAADRDAFAADVDASLDVRPAVGSTNDGVEASTISFSVPDVGSVTALMFDPFECSGAHPGVVLMHRMPGALRIAPSRSS